MFEEHVSESARRHAIAMWPKESVGCVVDGVYHRLTNVHEDPVNHFAVDNQELVKVKGRKRVQAIIHSHPRSEQPNEFGKFIDGVAYPSLRDMEGQLRMNVPWAITVSTPDSASILHWWGNVPYTPLWDENGEHISRTYQWGIYDCYSIIRHYHHTKYGIWIPDFARGIEFWNRRDPNNMYMDNFELAGFVAIPENEMRVGDCILIKSGSKITNHSGIYLGGDNFLHHPAGQQSRIDSVSQYWGKSRNELIVRHKSQIEDPNAGTN